MEYFDNNPSWNHIHAKDDDFKNLNLTFPNVYTLQEEDQDPKYASILNNQEFLQLQSLSSEKEVNQFLFSPIERVMKCKFTLVNSEEYRWLYTGSSNEKHKLKPDFFCTHPALFTEKLPAHPVEGTTYGVPCHTTVYDSLILFEGKTKYQPSDVAELENYIRWQNYNPNNHPLIKKQDRIHVGVYMNRVFCGIVKCKDGVVIEHWAFNWTFPGGVKLMQDTLQVDNSLGNAIDELCKSLQCDIKAGQSFLGAGILYILYILI